MCRFEHFLSTSVNKRNNMEENEAIIMSKSSSESRKATDTVSILVVDDDITCLSIVAAMLKKFHYEVATVKHPVDALCALRIKAGAFDLVVSDVHMPDMNGFELQQAISREFNLPVVLMSADDQEGIVLKGLESGAAFFIQKPIFPDDLRDLWQFVTLNKMENNQLVASAAAGGGDEENNSLDEMRKAPPVLNADESDEDELGVETSQSKGSKKIKRKVNWTNSLNNRFLRALNTIGLHNAVPKKILQVMNVPGLKRENVASHLQKYRIFLKKVSEIGMKKLQNPSPEKRKSFSSRIASVKCPRGPRFNGTFHKESAQLLPGATSCDGASISTPGSEPSGPSQLPSNPGNIQTPNTDITSLINQADHSRWFTRLANNSHQQNNDTFQFQGDLSRGLPGSFDASASTSNAYNVLAQWNSCITSNNDVSQEENNATSSTPTNASDVFANWNWNWSNTSFNEVSHDKNQATSSSTPTHTSDVFVNWNSCNKSYNEVVPDKNNTSTSTPSEQEHNFVGYTIAGIQRFLESAPSIQDTNSNVDVAGPVLTNDGHMDLDPMTSSMPFLAYFAPDDDTNAGVNDQYFPSDVIPEYYQTFQPSDHLQQHFLENVEDGGQMQESDYTREQLMSDLDELGIVIQPIDEPEEEGDLNFVVEDQVNAQNPHLEQIIGGKDIGTSSSQGVGMTHHWNNNASSNLEQVPNQREEDDFLESLLAPDLYVEDYTFEGQ